MTDLSAEFGVRLDKRPKDLAGEILQQCDAKIAVTETSIEEKFDHKFNRSAPDAKFDSVVSKFDNLNNRDHRILFDFQHNNPSKSG